MSDPADQFRRLKAWRGEQARLRAIPPSIILDEDVLARLLALQPKTLEQLGHVPGIGPSKLVLYGPGILRALHPEVVA